jgi:hypothetical protein
MISFKNDAGLLARLLLMKLAWILDITRDCYNPSELPKGMAVK